MFNKSRYYILGSAVMATLIIWVIHAYDKSQAAPKINPHPKYFVTVSGNIEPHMPYPQTLVFRATYGAYHPSCRVWISRLEGVRGIAGHPVYYPVHPDAKGNYKVSIPIDAYKPGKCGWKIAWVMSATVPRLPRKKDWVNDLQFGDLIDFGHVGRRDELPGIPGFSKATLYCSKGGIEHCTGSELGGGYAKFDVLRNKSYHFIQNIKNKRS